jgi:Protein of unknown function (DUF3592)
MPTFMRFALAAIGLLAVAVSFWLWRMNRKAASWPSVSGEIIASSLEQDPHDAGDSVSITYRFAVANRNFSSSQITYGARSNSAPAKERLVAAYPVGRKVTVYYDPRNPASAVLERQKSPSWLGLAAVGAIFAAIGLLAP